MLEILVKMASSEWLEHQVPLVTKVLVDHQVFQESLELMANQVPLVFLDVLVRRDQRECRVHPVLLVNQDLLDWLDPQAPLEDQENVAKEETLDRKVFLDPKDREELMAPLVSREKRVPLDLREKRA